MKDLLTQELVKEFLHYDPDTGVFTWRERSRKWFKGEKQHCCDSWNTRHAGKVAGNKYTKPHNKKSYLQVSVFDCWYSCHQLAFLYMNGSIPECIDHINGDGTDNRWCNLREVTHAENSRNLKLSSRNTTGVVGVSWSKSRNKWVASINVKGKTKFLGRFNELSDAVNARKEAEKLYNYHPNHGSERSL